MLFLRPLVASAQYVENLLARGDGDPSPTPPQSLPEIWATFSSIIDSAATNPQQRRGGINNKNGNSGLSGVTNSQSQFYYGAADINDLRLPRLLSFACKIKEASCLTVLISLLSARHNLLLGEPSAEIHCFLPELWPNRGGPGASKDSEDLKQTLRDTLRSLLKHATDWYPTCDHSPVAASWHMTHSDLSSDTEALRCYLNTVMVATHALRHDPPILPASRHIVATCLRRIVHCLMKVSCYTQAGLLCQFITPVDYSTAIRCIQDRSGADGVDAYYPCLYDLTLMEYIINAHNKRGEHRRRDAVLQIMSQLELNSNNSQEIQRQAAKLRKHRLLRALARQFLH